MDTTNDDPKPVPTADDQASKDAAWAMQLAAVDQQWQQERDQRAKLLPLNKAALFEALAAAGIAQVVVTFDGSGDSGQIEEVSASTADGTEAELPNTAMLFQRISYHEHEHRTELLLVPEVVDHLAYALLEHTHEGWENDDGAYGEFTYDVAAGSIRLAYNERYTETHFHEHEF